MAKPKKGAMMQFMVPLVDSTDFATIESAITESDFNSGATRKFYGVNHGVSDAFASGTISKTGRLVRSGVFQITLKGTENNYDWMQVRITKTGVAEQIIEWQNVDNDDSDILSTLTVIQSMASDAASAAAQANSRVLLVQSRLSDLDSRLASDTSDILSAATAAASRALINQSRISDIQSFLSDFQSDLLSHVDTTGVGLNASTMSDLRSAITAGPAGVVTVSDISDIASAVKATLASDISDILSAATAAGSRALINQSRISDVQSYLVAMSDALSDAHSDLASKIAGITASVSASDISDIASAVKATLASDISDILSAAVQTNSRALVNQSRVSDIYSLLSDFQSDFGSRIPKEPSARSQLSDLASDLRSYLVGISASVSDLQSAVSDAHSDLASKIAGITLSVSVSDISDIASAVKATLASDLSDILSAAVQVNSRVLLNQSRISDIYSLLSDVASDVIVMSGVQSDIYSLLTAGVTLGASDMSDLRSAITANGVLRAGADPTAVIGVTDTLAAKVDWLAAMSRNKVTQTSTKFSVRNDADTATVASAAVSDDGTIFTRGELG